MTDILDNNTDSLEPNKNYYQELVGDGRKFKTNEDLARGKYQSDNYIKILESRLDTLSDDYRRLDSDYKTRAKLEDLLDQYTNKSSSETPAAKDQQNQPFDQKQLDSFFSEKIQAHESARKQEHNASMVRERIIAKYGSEFQNTINTQIAELGLTTKEFNDLARTQPKLLLKTLGLDEQVKNDPFRAPPASQQRSNTSGPTHEKRTWSYYQDLKKKDPQKWLSKEIAVQMHNDAIALGDEFRDGDYFAYGHTN